DARADESGEEVWQPLARGAFERLPKLRQLPLAPDHRRVGAPPDLGRGYPVDDPPRGEGLGAALETQRVGGLDAHGALDEPEGGAADQDLVAGRPDSPRRRRPRRSSAPP